MIDALRSAFPAGFAAASRDGFSASRDWLQRRLSLGLLASVLIAVTLYMVWLGEAQFSTGMQIAFGWGILALLYLLQWGWFLRHPVWRILFIILAAFLTVRYMWWRTTQTLLWTGPIDFVGMALVYLAELYAMVVHLIGLFAIVWPMEREPLPLPDDPARLPTVDVFIPTFNEADDIVRVTAQAALQIDYPADKLRIHILDDGGTVAKRNDPRTSDTAWQRHYSLMRMARDLGVGYITRESNRHAKAGNVNHALAQTKGDLVLFLDCDHVPTRDILRNMVGHFIADEGLFLVQSPHFFINPAPVENNLSGIARLPDEGDMFYGAMQPGLDTWNASYFCGSAALLRRRCLEEVGGLSGSTITEDVETSISLHGRGYRSVYVRRPLVCGLAPESHDEFAIQRTRWAQGLTQVLLLHNPLFVKGLTVAQRLCYLNSAMFWFFGIPRLIYYIAPAAFLAGGLFIYHVSTGQVLAYSLPFVLSTFPVMTFVYGRTRRAFFSEIYESIQSVFIIPAVLSVLRNPTKPSFRVTPKGQTNTNEGLTPVSVVFLIVVVVNFAALIAGILHWQETPEHRDVIGITLGWCIYNLYVGIMSMGAFWERRQIRRHHRIRVDGVAQVAFPRVGKVLSGDIVDMSLTGMGISLRPDFEIKDREYVTIESSDSRGRQFHFEGDILHAFRRGKNFLCGVELRSGPQGFPQAVGFLYGDSERWMRAWESRFNSRGTLKLIGTLLRLGVRATILTIPVLLRATVLLGFRILQYYTQMARKGWVTK